MIQYIMNNKTIPAALHEHLRLPSFSSTYPTSLIHDEMFCQRCTGNVPLSDPLLITSDRTKFLQIQELSMMLPPTQNVATNVESTTGIKSGKMACTILTTVLLLTSLYAYIFETCYRPTPLLEEWFSVWSSP